MSKPKPAKPPTAAKTRTIVFPESGDDPTPVVLDEDNEALYAKSIGEIALVVNWLSDSKKSGKLTVSTRATAMGCLENYVAQLGRSLGYATDIEARQKAAAANIRAANQTIRELESQIGAAFPPDALKQHVEAIHRRVGEVWDGLGFCLADLTLGRYSASIKFSITIDSHASTFSERKVSENREKRAKVDEMAAEGLELVGCPSNNDPVALDTEANRAWIVGRLRRHFPSLKPFSWDSITADRAGDRMQLRHLVANVEYADLARLMDDESKGGKHGE